MALYLGIDTSNYTTSVAALDTDLNIYHNFGKLLPVPDGALGLRQSDAVFAHTKALPQIFGKLNGFDLKQIKAVGVSTRPRSVEGSYMPCFLAGESAARIIARTLQIPCFEFSHQEGHIAAVLFSEKRMELLNETFLAWHLSGGTTELLLIHPDKEKLFKASKIGGTTDISAGQLIDRTGAMLGLKFPSGKELDMLSKQSMDTEKFNIRVSEKFFSLSGMENQAASRFNKGVKPEELAGFILRSISQAVLKATFQAFSDYGKIPVLFSGGVAGSSIIRNVFEGQDTVFAAKEYSSDNALGIAVLAATRFGGLEF